MTVQYNQLVLTGGPLVFFRLLLRWRGCIFKLIYIDVIVFMILYATISCIYRFALPENLQRSFEKLVLFTYNFQSMIPVAFILGFYIQLIFSRFWHQFMLIPWVLKFAMALVAHLPGTGDRARILRRTCVRYILGSLIITCARINVVAKKRFPTFEHFVSAGIFTDEEVKLLEGMQLHVQPFAPLVWTTSLITLAEKEKLITNQHALILLITEVNNFRQGLLNLFFMDYVCVPLVYTQVVTLSVYSYFIASLFGRQFIMDSSPLINSKDTKDWYFPFFTITEFIIYVGLLKVAETLINPMGEDDEDFDINEVIDFNWKTAWCIVDGMKTSPPALVRDAYWRQSVVELPHTEESRRLMAQPFHGSMFDVDLPVSEYSGSAVSIAGGPRKSQDHTGRRSTIRRPSVITSLLSKLNISSPVIEQPAEEPLAAAKEEDLHEDASAPPKLSITPADETSHPTSVMYHPSKGYAEPIAEEAESEMESEPRSSPTAEQPAVISVPKEQAPDQPSTSDDKTSI